MRRASTAQLSLLELLQLAAGSSSMARPTVLSVDDTTPAAPPRAGLRPYQVEAVEAVERELTARRSTLLVLPTGCGKTVVFAEVARRWREAGRGRVLVIAHREELIRQACDKIETFARLTTTVEMGGECASLAAGDVVVATVQTLSSARRRERFGADHFGLIIIDEAHHAPAAQYRRVIDYFASAKVLGVTATPDRSDGEALGDIFASVAYVYEIREAIETGYLVPIRQRAVRVEGLDLSKVRTTAGDLNAGDLEEVLVEEANLHGIAVPTLELAGARPTIVFATSVAHAHELALVLNRYRAGCAVALDGSTESDARRRVIADFGARRVQFLVNCALFTEGFDAPLTACVAIARPTKSRALYAQMVGRGTRLAENKGDLLVLDFEGNAGRHALVTAMDILGGDPEVRERARRIAAVDAQVTVIEALDRAAGELAEEKRRAVIAQAKYEAVEIDPFEAAGIRRATPLGYSAPATDRQIGYLRALGVPDAGELRIDKRQASQLIAEALRRRELGLCSIREARELARRGLNPDALREEARELLFEAQP